MKVSDSYASLVQGVSQQVSERRRPGQHTEQVNMLPDPIEGLQRRHGSRFLAESDLDIEVDEGVTTILADALNFKTFEYTNNSTDYVLCIRRADAGASTLPFVIVYDKTNNAFLPIDFSAFDDDLIDGLFAHGAAAVTAVGRIVMFAANDWFTDVTSEDLWGDDDNKFDAVLWVRGGAYSRTFKITAYDETSTPVDFEYTTPASAYPGVLDTSGVPVYIADPAGGSAATSEGAYIIAPGVHTLTYGRFGSTGLTAKKGATTMTNVYPAPPASNTEFSWQAGDLTVVFHSSNVGEPDVTLNYTHAAVVANPNYATLISQITNAYQSAVTNWIGTAAEAIQPENIAEQLRLAAVAAGFTTAVRQGSTVIFDDVTALEVDDGGDGTLIRGVANEVTGVDKLSDLHKVGKIVRIRSKEAADTFYMVAQSKEGLVTSGYTEVRWVEGAGTEHTINQALFFGTVDSGVFRMGSSATFINALLVGSEDIPEYSVSTAGDSDSSPLPFFAGRQISYLDVFQDRLLIGAGAVVRASKSADYFNFFQGSIVTVPADDAFEVLSQGSEDDTLRHSVLYDKDLVIFGDKRQYILSGRVVMSPTNAAMPVLSTHGSATAAAPLAVGNYIFYGKNGTRAVSAHQIQPNGAGAEQPESFTISNQIATYLQGTVIELSKHDSPTHLFVRTTGLLSGYYVFSYLDVDREGRQQAAWHKFSYGEGLGQVMGLASDREGLVTFWLRQAVPADASPARLFVVVDRQPMTTGLSTLPYLDSMRTIEAVEAGEALNPNTSGDWFAAFDDSTEFFLLGSPLVEYEDLEAEFPEATGLWVGHAYDAYVTPTNPRVVDKNEAPINTGRLTVGQKLVTLKESSGMVTTLTGAFGTNVETYNGRISGDENNLIGREPITDQVQAVSIGRERRAYTLTLAARKWMPFTISSMEWVGQFFNRTRRG